MTIRHDDPISRGAKIMTTPISAIVASLLLVALMSEQAHAAGCASPLRPETLVKLELDDLGSPQRHPLRLDAIAEPIEITKGACGTWGIRYFTLKTATARGPEAAYGNPIGDQGWKAGRSSGTADVMIIPVLLLKAPQLAEASDQFFRDYFLDMPLKTLGKKFGSLTFKPEPPAFMALVFHDETQYVAPVPLIIGCGRCSPEIVAEGVMIAAKLIRKRQDPAAKIVSPQPPQQPPQPKAAPQPAQPDTKTAAKTATPFNTFVRFYDPRTGQPFEGPAPIAVAKCVDRELGSTYQVSRAGGSQISVLQDPKHGSEPVGLCLVFESANGAEKCVQVPLVEETGKRLLIPPRVEFPFGSVKAFEEFLAPLDCPPLPPYAIEIKLSTYDGKPIPVEQANVLMGDLSEPPRMFGRVLDPKGGGYQITLTKAEITEMRRGRVDPVGMDKKAFVTERIIDEPARRTATVFLKMQTVSIGDMRFELTKALGDPQRSCEVLLQVPRGRQLGRAWNNFSKNDLELFFRSGAFKIKVEDETDRPRLYVTLADDSLPLELKNKRGQWPTTCAVQATTLTRKEIMEGLVQRDVELPGPGLVSIFTADSNLAGKELLPDTNRQASLYDLGADVVQAISKRRPGDKSWSFGVLLDAQAATSGTLLKAAVRGDAALDLPEPKTIDLLVNRIGEKGTPLPVAAIGRVLSNVLRDQKVPDAQISTFPARVIYFGKVFERNASLCDNNAVETARNWEGDGWQTGSRRIMIVSVVAGADVQKLLSDKLIVEAEPSQALPVYRCTLGQTSNLAHYVLQAPDAVQPRNRSPLVNFLVDRAAKLFELN